MIRLLGTWRRREGSRVKIQLSESETGSSRLYRRGWKGFHRTSSRYVACTKARLRLARISGKKRREPRSLIRTGSSAIVIGTGLTDRIIMAGAGVITPLPHAAAANTSSD